MARTACQRAVGGTCRLHPVSTQHTTAPPATRRHSPKSILSTHGVSPFAPTGRGAPCLTGQTMGAGANAIGFDGSARVVFVADSGKASSPSLTGVARWCAFTTMQGTERTMGLVGRSLGRCQSAVFFSRAAGEKRRIVSQFEVFAVDFYYSIDSCHRHILLAWGHFSHKFLFYAAIKLVPSTGIEPVFDA